MDKLVRNWNNDFDKKISERDNQYQNGMGKVEEKTSKSTGNGQTSKTILKSIQEKKRKKDKKVRKKEDLTDSTILEALHVQRVYDQIAPHIEDLNQKTWPRVKEFLKSLKPGSLVADIGCGNGRYLHINPSIFKIGSDICQPFLLTATSRGFEVLTADNLLLPYRDSMFDAAISIGVIHHFASQERRVQALRELARIIVPGGLMMVYVWAFEQKYRKFDSQDILVPWHKPRKSDPGYRRPRTSSTSDMDRRSTSSTGSSVSDEDFTCSTCHQKNSCKVHRFECVESGHACHFDSNGTTKRKEQCTQECSHNIKTDLYQQQFSSKYCLAEGCHKSTEDTEQCTVQEHQLTKGEALIRECQKVESYLSSLCKNSWEFLPEKTKPSSIVSNNQGSTGSLEEYTFASTEKSSPSFQSLSFQDDDVFVDKVDSPEFDSPTKIESAKISQRKQLSAESAFDDSVVCDPLLLDSHQMEDKNCILGSIPFSSAQFGLSNGSYDKISSGKENDIGWGTNEDLRATFICQTDGRNSSYQKLHAQDNRGMTGKLHSAEDDFYIVDMDFKGSLHNSKTFMQHDHRVLSSPKNILNMLKQGFKSIFGKAKSENGRYAAPCIVPCAAFPQECFQIREFPLSSLPSGTVLENNTQFASGESVTARSTGSDPAFSCDAHLMTSDAVHNQNLSHNSLTYHAIQKGQQKKHISAAALYASDSSIVKESLGTDSSKIAETKKKVARTRKCSSWGGVSSCTSAKSKTLPSAVLHKGDAMNTDLCRFYHVFREGELEDLIQQYVPGVKVVDSFYDHANWCLILKKC